MTIKQRLILLIIALIGICMLPATAYAQEQTLRVSPAIITITLSPGKTYNHEITIENLSDAPLPLRATLSDFMTGGEDGGYVFEETKSNPLLSWIAMNETEFILNPKEKKTVQMTITTPKSIPVGGYYGVLFFEPVAQRDQTTTTRINAKVGVLMLANIGVPDPNAKKADILTFDPGLFYNEGTVPFILRVKNISLNFFSAKPNLSMTPILPFGNGSRQFELEEKTIFPGNIRRWSEDNTVTDLQPNIYKATMAVSTGNGQVVSAEKYFIVLPLVQLFILFVVITLIVFIVVKRKRIRKAVTILFRP